MCVHLHYELHQTCFNQGYFPEREWASYKSKTQSHEEGPDVNMWPTSNSSLTRWGFHGMDAHGIAFVSVHVAWLLKGRKKASVLQPFSGVHLLISYNQRALYLAGENPLLKWMIIGKTRLDVISICCPSFKRSRGFDKSQVTRTQFFL